LPETTQLVEISHGMENSWEEALEMISVKGAELGAISSYRVSFQQKEIKSSNIPFQFS